MKTNTFLSIICCILMIFILIMPQPCIIAATESLHLWSSSVFPSLFPFFVLSSILKQTGILEHLIHKSSKKFDYNLIFTTLIGMICGYPSTSKLIGESDMNNPLEVYALSTSPSPVFIIGTLATVFMQNTLLAIYIFTATYLSLTTSFIIVKYISNSKHNFIHHQPKINSIPAGHLLTTAILDGMKSQVIILGIITIISILIVFFEKSHIFSLISIAITPIASFLDIPKTAIPSFLKGLLEMTSGVNAICHENITIYHKLSMCGFMTSFGGMSIILESIAFINNKIKATSIVGIKLLHGCLTYLYIRLLLFIFPISQNVILKFGSVTIPPITILGISSITSIIILLLLRRILLREL